MLFLSIVIEFEKVVELIEPNKRERERPHNHKQISTIAL
jgi:hypothetical protein